MEKRWVRRNVNISFLGEYVARFFESRGFETLKQELQEGYRIVAMPSHAHDIRENVKVHILGRSDNFAVKFVAGSQSRALVRLGRLTALFGGGIFLVRGMKSEEALEKLEKDFWMFVGEKIDHLVGSPLE